MPEVKVNVEAVQVHVPPQEKPEVTVNVDGAIVNVPAPEVTVNVPENPTNVTVNVPEQPPAVINNLIPDQPAPVVNIAPADVTVNVPQQPVPSVRVEVTPDITLKMPKTVAAKVTRDKDGNITGIRPEE